MKKVLALVLAFALVACAALALAEEEVTVQTAEEYLALEDGELVCIETYAQAHEGWWKDDAGVGQCSIYAQDETCGYFIYNAPCSEEDAAKLVDGQKIRVTGTKMVWNGLVEIGNVKSLEILEGDPFVAETKDVTDLFGSEDIEQYMNQKVSFLDEGKTECRLRGGGRSRRSRIPCRRRSGQKRGGTPLSGGL